MTSYDFICKYTVPWITGDRYLTIVGVMIDNNFYFTPKDLCVRYQQTYPYISITDIKEYVHILPVVSKLEDILKFIKRHRSFENETIESLKAQLNDIYFHPEHHDSWERFLKLQ